MVHYLLTCKCVMIKTSKPPWTYLWRGTSPHACPSEGIPEKRHCFLGDDTFTDVVAPENLPARQDVEDSNIDGSDPL